MTTRRTSIAWLAAALAAAAPALADQHAWIDPALAEAAAAELAPGKAFAGPADWDRPDAGPPTLYVVDASAPVAVADEGLRALRVTARPVARRGGEGRWDRVYAGEPRTGQLDLAYVLVASSEVPDLCVGLARKLGLAVRPLARTWVLVRWPDPPTQALPADARQSVGVTDAVERAWPDAQQTLPPEAESDAESADVGQAAPRPVQQVLPPDVGEGGDEAAAAQVQPPRIPAPGVERWGTRRHLRRVRAEADGMLGFRSGDRLALYRLAGDVTGAGAASRRTSRPSSASRPAGASRPWSGRRRPLRSGSRSTRLPVDPARAYVPSREVPGLFLSLAWLTGASDLPPAHLVAVDVPATVLEQASADAGARAPGGLEGVPAPSLLIPGG